MKWRGIASIMIGGLTISLMLGALVIWSSEQWLSGARTKQFLSVPPTAISSSYDLAPEFTVPGLEVKAVTLSEHRGHKLLLNFFASWCIACREEMPGVQRQFEKHRIHGWVVIGMDIMEPAATVRAFRDEFGLTFPIGLDLTGKVSQQYRVKGTPTNIVIDKQGQIVEQRLGYMSEAELEKLFASLP